MLDIAGFRRVWKIRYTTIDGLHKAIWVETPFNDSSPINCIVQAMKENYYDVMLVKEENHRYPKEA